MTLKWGDKVFVVGEVESREGVVFRTDYPVEGMYAVRVEYHFYAREEDLIPTGTTAQLTYMADEAKEQLGGTIQSR